MVDRFAQACTEADAADALYDAADHTTLPPLLGIPCSIKEFVALKGMPHTGGVLHRKGVVATQDATVSARLRRAGAIPLASPMPEGGLWMETHNLIWGRTSNPWDVRRTCGGSSGGEGALVGSGATPFGIDQTSGFDSDSCRVLWQPSDTSHRQGLFLTPDIFPQPKIHTGYW